MQGFPEYAYTTAEKQPNSKVIAEALALVAPAVKPPASWANDAILLAQLFPDMATSVCFTLGYLAAVNRLPIFIIDPKDMLTKETN